MCLLRDIPGEGLWYVKKKNIWNVTCDAWHTKCDTWHMIGDLFFLMFTKSAKNIFKKCTQKSAKKCLKVFFFYVSKIGDFIVTMLLSALVERVRFEESLDESVFQYLLVNFFGFCGGVSKTQLWAKMAKGLWLLVWQVTGDMWKVTCDTWKVTADSWHVLVLVDKTWKM